MFREIKNVRQEPGDGKRRWFEAEGIELVVWLSPGDEIAGFQLVYDSAGGERALTWRPLAGFAHSVVDTGDRSPLKNETPVLMPDGEVPWEELARRFGQHSGSLDAEVRRLVQDQLERR